MRTAILMLGALLLVVPTGPGWARQADMPDNSGPSMKRMKKHKQARSMQRRRALEGRPGAMMRGNAMRGSRPMMAR